MPNETHTVSDEFCRHTKEDKMNVNAEAQARAALSRRLKHLGGIRHDIILYGVGARSSQARHMKCRLRVFPPRQTPMVSYCDTCPAKLEAPVSAVTGDKVQEKMIQCTAGSKTP